MAATNTELARTITKPISSSYSTTPHRNPTRRLTQMSHSTENFRPMSLSATKIAPFLCYSSISKRNETGTGSGGGGGGLTYKNAGVDIDAGSELVRRIAKMAPGIGGFGGLFPLGLLRCGKSCRLRWINYLRTDLKRGNISTEEEEIIVMLHATFGNKWSLIANQLSGRTDNEIKNYWNSHLGRKVHCFRKLSNEKLQLIKDIAAKASMEVDGKREEGKKKKKVAKENKRKTPKNQGVSNKKVVEISTNNNNEEIVLLPQTPELEKEKALSLSEGDKEQLDLDFVLPLSPCGQGQSLLSNEMNLLVSCSEVQEMTTSCGKSSSSFVFCPSGGIVSGGEKESEVLGPYNNNYEDTFGLSEVMTCFDDILGNELVDPYDAVIVTLNEEREKGSEGAFCVPSPNKTWVGNNLGIFNGSGDNQNSWYWNYSSCSSMASPPSLDDNNNSVDNWSWEDLIENGCGLLLGENDLDSHNNYTQSWLNLESNICGDQVVASEKVDNVIDFEKQNALVAWLFS